MIDEKQRYEPIPAPDCVVAFAVWADYDGNAPDTSDVILLSNLELAEAVKDHIAKHFNKLCYCDGWEFSKAWTVRETVAKRNEVYCSFAEAIESLGEPSEEDDEEGDGEWSE